MDACLCFLHQACHTVQHTLVKPTFGLGSEW